MSGITLTPSQATTKLILFKKSIVTFESNSGDQKTCLGLINTTLSSFGKVETYIILWATLTPTWSLLRTAIVVHDSIYIQKIRSFNYSRNHSRLIKEVLKQAGVVLNVKP